MSPARALVAIPFLERIWKKKKKRSDDELALERLDSNLSLISRKGTPINKPKKRNQGRRISVLYSCRSRIDFRWSDKQAHKAPLAYL